VKRPFGGYTPFSDKALADVYSNHALNSLRDSVMQGQKDTAEWYLGRIKSVSGSHGDTPQILLVTITVHDDW
jgi:hypothetical protein